MAVDKTNILRQRFRLPDAPPADARLRDVFEDLHAFLLDDPELTIQEVREEILEAHHMEKGRRLIQDYDFIMDRAAEAEELGLNSHPSTLEKLASLAGAKEKCDAPECSLVGCRKVRDAHEL